MTVWSRLCGAWAPLLGPFVVIVILVTASLGRRYLHGTLCDSDSMESHSYRQEDSPAVVDRLL